MAVGKCYHLLRLWVHLVCFVTLQGSNGSEKKQLIGTDLFTCILKVSLFIPGGHEETLNA